MLSNNLILVAHFIERLNARTGESASHDSFLHANIGVLRILVGVLLNISTIPDNDLSKSPNSFLLVVSGPHIIPPTNVITYFCSTKNEIQLGVLRKWSDSSICNVVVRKSPHT